MDTALGLPIYQRSRHHDMRDTRLHELPSFRNEPVLRVEARGVGLGMQPHDLVP